MSEVQGDRASGAYLRLLAARPQFTVDTDGRGRAGRALALLAYLRLGPPRVSRDELAEILWDPESGGDAGHRLRELISTLRRVLPAGVLVTDGQEVCLNQAAVRCDVADFRQAISEGRLVDAAALYGADFLSGAFPPKAALFEEWASGIGRGLRREYGMVLGKLVASSRAREQFQEAAQWADRLWRLEPDAEEWATELLRLRCLSGDVAGSLAAAAAVEWHFSDAFGEVPDEVAALLEQARILPELALVTPTVDPDSGNDRVEAEASPAKGGLATPGQPVGHAAAPHGHVPAMMRLRWPLTLLVGGAVLVAAALAIPSQQATPEAAAGPIFGGGGRLYLRHTDGRIRALDFVGPRPTDTLGVVVTGRDTLIMRMGPYSPVRHAVAESCTPDRSDHRSICVWSIVTDEAPVVLPLEGDNAPSGWSPDGAWLLVRSDRGSQQGRYSYDAWALHLASGAMRRLSDTPYETEGSWSPDGSRVALRMLTPAGDSVLIVDAGSGAVLDRLAFSRWVVMAWSPDGEVLALAESMPDGSNARIHVAAPMSEPTTVELPDVRQVIAASWSPDGVLLAHLGVTPEGSSHLRICEWASCQAPLLEIPDVQWLLWVPEDPTPYLEVVRLTASREWIAAGDTLHISLTTRDGSGRDFRAPHLTFALLDPEIGWLDSRLTFHALRPGVARLVADAGGWRADTLIVKVAPAPEASLLMSETWANGLDTTTWRPFGVPLPSVVPVAGGWAFRNNGDSLYPSGVVSRTAFEPSQGLTIEWRQSTPLTGDLWQEVWIHLSTGPLEEFRVSAGPPYPEKNSPIHINSPILVSTPPIAMLSVQCGGGLSPLQDYPSGLRTRTWHEFAFQLRADGRCELFVDGILSETTRTSAAFAWDRPLHLMLGGRTHRTDILLGDVRVWQGVRWAVDQSGQARPLASPQPPT